MSEPKNFLQRWSARKLDPEAEKTSDEKPPLPAAGQKKESAETVPPFDISSLPSLDSITANSDIRAFLQAGVPAELTRAALRRVWSADPAIRDFVGLAENAWDFNAPNAIHGFGPLTAEDAKQLAGRLLDTLSGGQETKIAAQAESDPPKTKNLPAASAKQELDSKPDASDAGSEQADRTDVAMQHEKPDESDRSPTSRRRHGGALPE